jgi:uncharacterized protein (TIGR02118 family)
MKTSRRAGAPAPLHCTRNADTHETGDAKEDHAMARLVVMYRMPQDAAAFDKYYVGTHVPIAKKLPGLRKYEISQGAVATPAGPSSYHLVAILHFDDMAAIQKAFASPEGQAAVADVGVFATGGVDIFMFDHRDA